MHRFLQVSRLINIYKHWLLTPLDPRHCTNVLLTRGSRETWWRSLLKAIIQLLSGPDWSEIEVEWPVTQNGLRVQLDLIQEGVPHQDAKAKRGLNSQAKHELQQMMFYGLENIEWVGKYSKIALSFLFLGFYEAPLCVVILFNAGHFICLNQFLLLYRPCCTNEDANYAFIAGDIDIRPLGAAVVGRGLTGCNDWQGTSHSFSLWQCKQEMGRK